MYGPVRTVVWEGRSREAPPYPDCATALRVTAPPIGWDNVLLYGEYQLNRSLVRSERLSV